jgi:uncharacterized protein (UPF0335 family)
MIDKLLRPFVADQLKALMEKLETQEIDARSLRKIGEVLSEMKLTRFERYVVGRVYKRVRRMSDMDRIMNEIIIGEPESGYDINMDLNARLRASMNSPTTDTSALWSGAVPVKKHLDIRPKARA